MTRDAWLVVGLLVFGHLLLALALGPASDRLTTEASQTALFSMAGLCIGQANLIAAWAALAPGNVFVRVPWAIFLSVLVWYALTIGATVAEPEISLNEALMLGLVVLIFVFVAQLPLWIVGRLLKTRLVPPVAKEDPLQRRQFNTRQLLMGMAVTSVTLALGRLVLPGGEINAEVWDGPLFVFIVPVFAVANLAVAAPCIWGAFAPWRWMPVLLGGWLALILFVSLIQFVVVIVVEGGHIDLWEGLSLFMGCNTAQCVTVLGTLMALRQVGFRLERVPHDAPPAQAKA